MKEKERLCYLEQKFKDLINELKSNNGLGENFTFFTEAERCSIIEERIDEFLSRVP